MTARLVLSSGTVRTGGALNGNVVVVNDTGHALRVTTCGGPYQAALTSRTYHPAPVWPTCLMVVTVPPGRSTYPVSVLATYLACSPTAASGGFPRCTAAGGPPALPVGRYEATAFEMGDTVPLPPPVEVRVER